MSSSVSDLISVLRIIQFMSLKLTFNISKCIVLVCENGIQDSIPCIAASFPIRAMNTVDESVNVPERETYSSCLVGVLAPQVKGNGTRPRSLDGATLFFPGILVPSHVDWVGWHSFPG